MCHSSNTGENQTYWNRRQRKVKGKRLKDAPGGAAGTRWRIPLTPDGRTPPRCPFSVVPTGLWETMTYPYPPLKRWAIADRPCGADGADARGLWGQPKSGGRETIAQRFIAGQTARVVCPEVGRALTAPGQSCLLDVVRRTLVGRSPASRYGESAVMRGPGTILAWFFLPRPLQSRLADRHHRIVTRLVSLVWSSAFTRSRAAG